MLEIGKTYKTLSGKEVKIISENDKPQGSCEVFEALVTMDHNKHWTMYSRDGRCYESAHLDIDTTLPFSKLDEVLTAYKNRPGITISMYGAFKEGLFTGLDLVRLK